MWREALLYLAAECCEQAHTNAVLYSDLWVPWFILNWLSIYLKSMLPCEIAILVALKDVTE